jgi:hypothetical protein
MGASSNNLSDKYLQFFANTEATAAATTLQIFDYDTGMSPRGGWLWEIYQVEILPGAFTAVPAAAAIYQHACAVSMVGGLTVIPNLADYGTLFRRQHLCTGTGTNYIQHQWSPVEERMVFPKPFIYAKSKIYLYVQHSNAVANTVTFRIGYITRKVSGALLWEAVEQFMTQD